MAEKVEDNRTRLRRRGDLAGFVCAVAASTVLHHWLPALLVALAVCCWLTLALRTLGAIRRRQPLAGQALPQDSSVSTY